MKTTKYVFLFFLIIMLSACGRQPSVLSRMELQQNGHVLATIRFMNDSSGKDQAQAFDSEGRWLFTVQPQLEKGKLHNVTYSSSNGAQRATYELISPDTLLAVFQTTDDFKRNTFTLDRQGRIIHRTLTFQRQPLFYEIDVSWKDNLPERIDYSYHSERYNIPSQSGGSLLFESNKGLVTGVVVEDENINSDQSINIVCHYTKGKGNRHDWSEKEFYLPTPLLLLSVYSSYRYGE